MATGSARVWIACALVTAVAVAVAIRFTSKPTAEADGQMAPEAPPPLTEQEVRSYLDVAEQLDPILKEAAFRFQTTRKLGEADDKEGDKTRARVEAMLQTRHLTIETWGVLKGRVERAVDIVRAAQAFEEAKPGIQDRIKIKKDALKDMPPGDSRRAPIEKDITDSEALLVRGPPQLGEKDMELVRRYWAGLNRWVPPVGAPPKKPAESPGSPSGN